MIERELSEFGRRMGLSDIALPENGALALTIDGLGQLYIERGKTDDFLFLYLARPLAPYDRTTLPRAFGLCHSVQAYRFPLAVGLRGDLLLIMTRLSQTQINAALLEQAAAHLFTAAQKLDSE